MHNISEEREDLCNEEGNREVIGKDNEKRNMHEDIRNLVRKLKKYNGNLLCAALDLMALLAVDNPGPPQFDLEKAVLLYDALARIKEFIAERITRPSKDLPSSNSSSASSVERPIDQSIENAQTEGGGNKIGKRASTTENY